MSRLVPKKEAAEWLAVPTPEQLEASIHALLMAIPEGAVGVVEHVGKLAGLARAAVPRGHVAWDMRVCINSFERLLGPTAGDAQMDLLLSFREALGHLTGMASQADAFRLERDKLKGELSAMKERLANLEKAHGEMSACAQQRGDALEAAADMLGCDMGGMAVPKAVEALLCERDTLKEAYQKLDHAAGQLAVVEEPSPERQPTNALCEVARRLLRMRAELVTAKMQNPTTNTPRST